MKVFTKRFPLQKCSRNFTPDFHEGHKTIFKRVKKQISQCNDVHAGDAMRRDVVGFDGPMSSKINVVSFYFVEKKCGVLLTIMHLKFSPIISA